MGETTLNDGSIVVERYECGSANYEDMEFAEGAGDPSSSEIQSSQPHFESEHSSESPAVSEDYGDYSHIRNVDNCVCESGNPCNCDELCHWQYDSAYQCSEG